MGVLEQISEMQRQGMPDEEITTVLREQGFSPRDIKDAIEQSQIKNAVYPVSEEIETPVPESQRNQPSPRSVYTPQTKEIAREETYPNQGSYPQEKYGQYPSQETYQPDTYEYPQEAFGTDTIIEIAEQVFSEKAKKMSRKISELAEFKSVSESRIENALERIKRIEATMDRLQSAILEKIGSYGKNLEGIKKEMSMMQDSFGKVINSAADNREKTEDRRIKQDLEKISAPSKNSKKKIQ